MSIQSAFKGTSLFIPFIMAGHPTKEVFVRAILELSRSGCGIIEIGVPFSDPLADGPMNQHAAEIALKNNISMDVILEVIREVRNQGVVTPILMFSYFNPIIAMGLEQFIIKAKLAGVDGVLIVDLPPEEGEEIFLLFQEAGLEVVLLASPTTDPVRFQLYQKIGPAFIYYISRCGVTGTQSKLAGDLEQEVKHLRSFFPKDQKIAVGFGISTLEQVKQVAQFADGVVVGSFLVQLLDNKDFEGFRLFVSQCVDGIQLL